MKKKWSLNKTDLCANTKLLIKSKTWKTNIILWIWESSMYIVTLGDFRSVPQDFSVWIMAVLKVLQ